MQSGCLSAGAPSGTAEEHTDRASAPTAPRRLPAFEILESLNPRLPGMKPPCAHGHGSPRLRQGQNSGDEGCTAHGCPSNHA